MKINKIDHEDLYSTVEVKFDKEDIVDDYKKSLKKYSAKADMKGFRKGKVPTNVIKKMYGSSILADIVLNKVEKELNAYLKDNDIRVIGQPLPSESQKTYQFDPGLTEEFEFKFDVAPEPEFDIIGIDKEDSYSYYDCEVDEKNDR